MSSLDTRHRRAAAATWLLLVPPILVLLFELGLMPWELSGGELGLLWFATSVVAAVVATLLSERYRSRYKTEVVAPLIEQIDPSAIYEPNAKLDPAVLDATGLFPPAPETHSDDRIRGNVNGVPFQLSNVYRWRTITRYGRGQREIVFRGLFLQIALPFTVDGLTCLIGDNVEATAPQEHRKTLKQVDLGLGERFDAQFDVWTTNPTDAKALLTPELTARLAEYGEDSDYPPRLAFHDGFVSVAVASGDMLEPSISGGRQAADTTAVEVDRVFRLVRELIAILQAHSPRFASRRVATLVGESARGAASADAGSAHAGAADNARAAAVAAASPWDQHGRAKPTGDVRQAAERVRALGIGVELEGTSTMTLQYGLRPGLFYALVIGLLWTALAVNIAGIATGTPGEGSLLRLTTTLPMLTEVVTWLAQYHPAATAIALVAGLVSLSSAFRHIRRVQLTRSGVETNGALWPVTRRHTIAAAPSVTLLQRGGVFIGSTRVSPPLPFGTGAVVAQAIASFFGVEASVPIEEPAITISSDLRVGGKRRYSSSRR